MKLRALLLGLFFLAAGCRPVAPTSPTALAVTATAFLPATSTAPAPATPSPDLSPNPSSSPLPRPRNVLIVSIDGLRGDALYRASMPALWALAQQGASTFQAQTILPSATLPAHTSMLSGMCPARHGVSWNDYIPAMGEVRGTTLFDLAGQAGLRTSMVVGKEKLAQAVHRASLEAFRYIAGSDLQIAQTAAGMLGPDFGLMFVHFPVVDGEGHSHGWLSPQQLRVIERADSALDLLIRSLRERGLEEETLIIVTADHGGHDFTHGTNRPEDMTIPWVVAGPGVVPGTILESPVSVMDTAATAAWALGLEVPSEWDGRAVTEAFGLIPTEMPERDLAEICIR